MNNTDSGALDLSKLWCVRRIGKMFRAQCPACAETGGDNRAEHLVIFETGQFGCARFPGDHRHRRRIFELAGITGNHELNPEQARRRQQERAREQRDEQEKRRLINVARAKRAALIDGHLWSPEQIVESSPQLIDCWQVACDPRHFLKSLFHGDDLVWTGTAYESGNEKYACHWRTCREWCCAPAEERVGLMVSSGIWKPRTISRAATNVLSAPYTVLDFDGFDGIKPETPEQIDAHIRASLALIRWLMEGLCWKLAAILWTGGKGLHAWFHRPPQHVLDSLETTAEVLGLDAGLIGHPEHPCRLPGHRHQDTGNISRVVWLQQVPNTVSGEHREAMPAPILPRIPPIPSSEA